MTKHSRIVSIIFSLDPGMSGMMHLHAPQRQQEPFRAYCER